MESRGKRILSLLNKKDNQEEMVPLISASRLLAMAVNTTDDGLFIETPSSSVLENMSIIYDTDIIIPGPSSNLDATFKGEELITDSTAQSANSESLKYDISDGGNIKSCTLVAKEKVFSTELSSNPNVVTNSNELQNMEVDTTDDLNVGSNSLVVLRNVEVTPTGVSSNSNVSLEGDDLGGYDSDDSLKDRNYSPRASTPTSGSSVADDLDELPATSANLDPNISMPESIRRRKVKQKTLIKQSGRKRVRHKEKWQSSIRKECYASGQAYISKKGKKVSERQMRGACKCRMKCFEKISEDERHNIFKTYWNQEKSVDTKRQYIRSCIEVKDTQRNRNRDVVRTKNNTLVYSFVVRNVIIKVCKKMFLDTIAISNTVVVNILKKGQDGGMVEEDKRGKHIPGNKTPENIRLNVKQHIDSIPAYESHYSREWTAKKYLGSDLTIEKLYQLYLEWCTDEDNNISKELVAKKWFYSKVFNTEYNLSFKSPEVDTCDDCDTFIAKIKSSESETDKTQLQGQHDAHIHESKIRYDKKHDDIERSNTENNVRILTVDLQKCLPTPLLTCGLYFYKRKVDTEKQPVLISNAVQLQVRKGEIGILYFKTNFKDDFRKVNLKRNARSSDLKLPEKLKPVNERGKDITEQKYKDLLSLLPFTNSYCHDFYKNLRYNKPGNNDYPTSDED